jgi:DASH complex subunit DAM1
LVDESASLAHNLKNLSQLHDALGTFNDSFAAYLYALKMNAFCVDWKEGPDDRSFKRMDSMGRKYLFPF